MSSEKICSTSSYVAEKQDSSFTPLHLNMLVFLNRKWHLIETTTASVVNSKTKTGEESEDDITDVGSES